MGKQESQQELTRVAERESAGDRGRKMVDRTSRDVARTEHEVCNVIPLCLNLKPKLRRNQPLAEQRSGGTVGLETIATTTKNLT